MADKSKIQWTDSTWQIITGCSRVSPGCVNCYAEKLAASRLRHHPSRVGLTKIINGHATWTGEVRFNEQWLDQPLRWKRGRRIFVCAHGDLFHENVPDEWIDKVFAVMALAPQHTFQVLTKRAERMRHYVTDRLAQPNYIGAQIKALAPDRFNDGVADVPWPLPNIHLGVSVEDQPRADERLPHLLATLAAVLWVSYEPALGAVDFTAIPDKDGWRIDALRGEWSKDHDSDYMNGDPGGTQVQPGGPCIGWIVVGGESGREARPFDLAWARAVVEQCKAAEVACFIKQLGKTPYVNDPDSHNQLLMLKDLHGENWDEWPADLRVR